MRDRNEIGGALDRLAAALESLDFGPDTAQLEDERDRIAGIIRSYLIPRSADRTTPMLVVFAGPTGSGKSTLVNSLSGLEVSRTGPLRPTTTAPVVLADREHAFDRIAGVECEVVVGRAPILENLALVDTPDIDSTATEHRAITETLIDNADVVVFVTSALRYADLVPWQVLRRARSRGTPVIHVLNRVSSSSSGAIVDLKSRLDAAGLDDRLITVPQHYLGEDGQRVPSLAVRSLAKRLASLAANKEEVAGNAFARVLDGIVAQSAGLARSIDELVDDIDDLEAGLSVELSNRVPRLTLDGVGDGLYPPPPDPQRERALRRWRRRAGPERHFAKAGWSKVVDRVESIVHADIRHYLSGEGRSLRERGLPVDDLASRVRPAARSAAEGWSSFVHRMATDHDHRNSWLMEAVLADAATSEGPVPAVGLLFGDEAAVLVDRARRELLGRLDVVYQLVVSLVVDAVRQGVGDLEVSELRAALGGVAATLTPVHA